jgi:2-polyprenyl-6-hydroxyphenyl methylase/3-demethylubiquinone-9 3-methyltransferase
LLEVYGDIASNRGYAYAYENRRKQVAKLINTVADPGDRIVDMAAAQGNFSLDLAERGYDVTWNDIRGDLAEYVEMKRETGTIHYKPGNAFEVDFGELFDVVLANEVIEHVAHPDEFLMNLSKLVKDDGHILVTTALGTYFKNTLPKSNSYSA